MSALRDTTQALAHPALVYAGIDEFLDTLVPFIREGLERDEPVFAAIGREEVDALGRELGRHSGATVADTRAWHPHPASRLRAFHAFVSDRLASGARAIKLIGEPAWEGRVEYDREWARYESVLNSVLAPFPVTLVCTYPSDRLDASIVSSAQLTHPSVRDEAGSRASGGYVQPDELLSRWTPPIDEPPPGARTIRPADDLHSARRFVREHASEAGVPADRLGEVALAATEVIGNAIEHGDGDPIVRTWATADEFVTQVEDRGPGAIDPLAGYRPPTDPGGEDGRGLWIARQVVDLLEIASTGSGTIVRLHVRTA